MIKDKVGTMLYQSHGVYFRFLSSSNLRARSSKLTSSPPAVLEPGPTVETLMVGTVGSSGIKVSDWPLAAAGVPTEGRGNHWPPPPSPPGGFVSSATCGNGAVYGGRYGWAPAGAGAGCNQCNHSNTFNICQLQAYIMSYVIPCHPCVNCYNLSLSLVIRQESLAIAKMTVRCALYT